MVKHRADQLTYRYSDVLAEFGIDPWNWMEILFAVRGSLTKEL